MYFNENNSNTNIDKEFNQEKNNLSHILFLLNKYKLFIIGIVIILIILMIFIILNRKINNYIILTGEENITLYQGTDYIEPGYSAYNSKDKDLTNEVIIKSTLDTSKIGEYKITYTIRNITKTRIITVIEKPKEYTYIYLKTINNDINIYLKVNEEYVEPGYQVFSSTGLDLTNQVKVTGDVDTSKKGTYKLIYSVIDSNGVTISAERTIIIMDTEIILSLNNTSYVNNNVSIEVKIMDNYFDYMILPDNTKVTDNTYSYSVSENGTYNFKVYNKKGVFKENSIKVTNIDKTPPTGSCNGSYKDGKSTININANDNIGISKYVMNGIEYTNNKVIIKTEITTAHIKIYDKAGNVKEISCNLTDKNEIIVPEKPITSDKNITFTYEYVSDGNYMPYALYTPSTASKNTKTPLIVWLHGSDEVGAGEKSLKNSGLLKVINEWQLDGFNAYVICPQLTSGNWNNSTRKDKLNELLDKIVIEKNIDKDKISLTGHSLGGIGVLYMAYYRPTYYSSLVVLSGYNPIIDYSTLKNIPIRGYTERSDSFMVNNFANTFGSDKLTITNGGHANVPKEAFTEDKNNDNKSDLIEWILTQ